MRLIPRSIHGRMLALSLIATLVALAIAGVGIAGVLERFVTQGLDQRLDAELSLLASTVEPDGRIDRARLVRVRGALDPGPDWQWRIVTPGETLGSADFPPLRAPGRRHGPGEMHDEPGPSPIESREGDAGAIHARQLTIATGAGPVVLSAAAPFAVVARPIRGALLPLLGMLAILAAALGIATVVQLRVGLRPLRRIRDSVAAIRTGGALAVPEDQPDELRPLAAELNALVRDNATALAVARGSAANLAHALKTPVATLALELADHPGHAAQVARLDATIRHHLGRARNAAVDRRASTPLAPAIADLSATVLRLRVERGIVIVHEIPAALTVAMDPADLDELAGNLIDNAVRHARARVLVRAVSEQAGLRLMVIDDGPGISAADRARATAPGVRLDESDDGHGFGLAIARELAALHGGALLLDEAPGGGLSASVTLPNA